MFFIVGRGRSGTSLLGRMLDSHPAIGVAPEALFVLHLWRRYGARELDEPAVHRFVRDLWREERLRRWRLEPTEVERQLAALAPASFARLCATVYALHATASDKPDALLLGDKNPHYALFVDCLAEIFPRARFVHLVRDYRDNILSYQNVRFDLASVSALAYRWRRYNQEIVRSSRRFPAQFLRMRYEDLVDRPESTLEEVCRFLGLAFEPSMLDFHTRRPDFLPGWHRLLDQPLAGSQVAKWRGGLGPAALAIADRVCQPLGAELGYQPAADGATRLRVAPGVFLGWSVTELERSLFRLPLEPRTAIIRAYRRLTGNRIE
jgi:hypothetical protein